MVYIRWFKQKKSKIFKNWHFFYPNSRTRVMSNQENYPGIVIGPSDLTIKHVQYYIHPFSIFSFQKSTFLDYHSWPFLCVFFLFRMIWYTYSTHLQKKLEKSIINNHDIDWSISNFEKRHRCASMGWQRVSNKKKFARICQVFVKLFFVTGHTQKKRKNR